MNEENKHQKEEEKKDDEKKGLHCCFAYHKYAYRFISVKCTRGLPVVLCSKTKEHKPFMMKFSEFLN